MEILLIIISTLSIIQGVYTIYSMLYAWNSESQMNLIQGPKEMLKPKTKFTILLPAWQEEAVLAQTIKSVAAIDYPKELTQILILLRVEDLKTIEVSKTALESIIHPNIKILEIDDKPRNKPNQLNWGLKEAWGDYVTIFDAEDEISPQILNVINSELINNDYDIVQNGVQLMNINTKWFSMLNALEYYFWFKSVLSLYSKSNVLPLAGNSLFIRRSLLVENNGWDENCLTEDCELGIRLAVKKRSFGIIYNPQYSTQEETPGTLSEFIKQRSRWTQGFIQIFFKGEWQKLSKTSEQFTALYILLWPMVQNFYFVFLLFSICVLPFLKVSLWVSLLLTFPLILLVIQVLVLNYGIYTFTQEYNQKYSILYFLKIVITFVPYQFVLIYSNFRAILRHFSNNTNWEKTKHLNNHRALL